MKTNDQHMHIISLYFFGHLVLMTTLTLKAHIYANLYIIFLTSKCRNLPFCGRARRGSPVRFPKEENAWSRHQRLFVENVRKTEGNRS